MGGLPPIWPWDAAQAFFEGLWDWIGEAATAAVSPVSGWINDSISWLYTQIREGWIWIVDRVSTIVATVSSGVTGVGTWLFDQLSTGMQALTNALSSFTDTVGSTLSGVLSQVATTVQDVGGWLSSTIWGWVDGGLRWATDTFQWLRDETAEVGAWVVDEVKTLFDGGFAGVLNIFAGWPELLTGAISRVFDPLLASLGGEYVTASPGIWEYHIPAPAMDAPKVGWFEGVIGKGLEAGAKWILESIRWISGQIVGFMNAVQGAITPVLTPVLTTVIYKATEGLLPGSPPEEVEDAVTVFSKQILKRLSAIPPKHHSPLPTLPELLTASAGVVGLNLLTVFGMDSVASYLDMAHPLKMTGIMNLAGDMINSLSMPAMIGPILFSNIYAGIIVPLRYRWNEMYTPMIPPQPDLVRMVVREAFVPEMVIKAPEVFAASMQYHGFSTEWSDRYWTAHFVPIALRQAYDNLWRGYWNKEQFMHALHIADIHPMWREDIYKVAFRPPGVREMGYGYDTGLYSVEDIVEYRRWGGLSPEDAEKAGLAMVAYRTEAEREALRREAIADFIAYLDDEEELRANLSSIGGRPEIVELWVARAQFRRGRDLVLDLAKDSVNQFIKGWIQEEQLRNDLRELGVVAAGREKMIEEANTRKLRYVREATVEKKKQIPVSRVRKARDLGIIGDEEYVLRLIDHDFTEVDARLDLAIELTPRPITPEEIERRQRTITSRLERARRRWETRLARVEAQIKLSALQRDDAEAVMNETLDVIDVQIAIIDGSIPLVTPENAKTLMDQRVVLVQRREVTVARFTARINKLLEQYSDLQEAKTLYERHRDEEIGEYEEELRIIGGVAG